MSLDCRVHQMAMVVGRGKSADRSQGNILLRVQAVLNPQAPTFSTAALARPDFSGSLRLAKNLKQFVWRAFVVWFCDKRVPGSVSLAGYLYTYQWFPCVNVCTHVCIDMYTYQWFHV